MKKMLFLLTFVIILTSFSYAYSNSDILWASQMEGNCNDYNGVRNFTNTGLTSTTGIHNNALLNNNNSANGCRYTTNFLSGKNNVSICFWYNVSAWDETDTFFAMADDASISLLIGDASYPNNFRVYSGNGKATASMSISRSFMTYNTWQHICYVANNAFNKIYVNAIAMYNDTESGVMPTTALPLAIATRRVTTEGSITGAMDEVYIFNISLNASEVSSLYSSGTGTFLPFTVTGTPTFENPTPLNGDRDTNSPAKIINVSCSSAEDLKIYFDQNPSPITAVFNKSSTLIGNWTILNGTNSYIDGTYYYKASCGATSTATRTFIIDNIAPYISLNSNNFFTSSNLSAQPQYNGLALLIVNISITHTPSALYGFEFNITNSSGSPVYSYRNESLGNPASFNFTAYINYSSWPSNQEYTINIWASDSHTKKYITDYQINKISNGLEFETEHKNRLRIYSNESVEFKANKTFDRYEFDLSFDSKGKKKRYIFLEAEKITYLTNSSYKAHFILGDWKRGNWIDFEGTESNPTVTKISDHLYKIEFDSLDDKIKFQSIGGLNINHQTYTWYKGQLTKSAPPGTSGSPSQLSLSLSKNSTISDINVGLIYDGLLKTNISKSVTASLISFTAFLPAVNLTNDTTYNYIWNISVTQSDSSSYRFNETGTHTIYNFIIDNCTVAKTPTLILSIFDELLPNSRLNGTLEVDGTFWVNPSEEHKQFNLKYSSASDFTLCIYPNETTLYADMYIKYTVPSGFTHRWYIVNSSFNNITQSILMGNYNLTSGISQLKLTLRKVDNYKYFPNVIGKLQRRYLSEGVWRTVQMDESDEFGYLSFNIQERITDYRLIFLDRSNNILKTTQSSKFSCSSSLCELTYQLNPYSSTASSSLPAVDVKFSNLSKLLNISWIVTDGSSILIRSLVNRETASGTLNICDSSASGAAGLFTCNLSQYTGTVLLSVLVDGDLFKSQFIEIPKVKLSDMIDSGDAAIYSFFLSLPIIAFGIFSPAGVVICAILALIVVFLFGFLNAISIIFISVAVVLGLYIALRVRR